MINWLFIFVPLTTSTMGHLRQAQMANATGLFNLMRNIGGSIGIAFVATFLDRDAQVHQAMMVSHMTPYDPAFVSRVASTKAFMAGHADMVTAAAQTWQMMGNTLHDQARLWAFVAFFIV